MGVADTLIVYASLLYGGRIAWAGAADVFVGAAGWIAGGCGIYQPRIAPAAVGVWTRRAAED